jgi:hypothetical protein
MRTQGWSVGSDEEYKWRVWELALAMHQRELDPGAMFHWIVMIPDAKYEAKAKSGRTPCALVSSSRTFSADSFTGPDGRAGRGCERHDPAWAQVW